MRTLSRRADYCPGRSSMVASPWKPNKLFIPELTSWHLNRGMSIVPNNFYSYQNQISETKMVRDILDKGRYAHVYKHEITVQLSSSVLDRTKYPIFSDEYFEDS